jgi:hypothetical protein
MRIRSVYLARKGCRCRALGCVVPVVVGAIALLTSAGCGEPVAAGPTVTQGVTVGSTSTTLAVGNPALAEEYAVYNALLEDGEFVQQMSIHTSGFQLIVIRTPTAPSAPDGWDETVRGMRKAWPELSDEIYSDYKTKEASPADLESLFALDAEYVVANLDDIFSKGPLGWQDFDAEYPSADGMLTLSRVGFNERMDAALLCVSYYQGGLSGAGRYVLLKKVGSKWIVREGYGFWVS